MNLSVHRAGLAIAAVAALTMLGGFFVVDGYVSAQRQPAVGAIPALAATSAPTAPATAVPEIVYVRPAPSPRVIHVTRTAPPVAPKIVHVTVPGAGGGEGHEGGEGGGDGGFETGGD